MFTWKCNRPRIAKKLLKNNTEVLMPWTEKLTTQIEELRNCDTGTRTKKKD